MYKPACGDYTPHNFHVVEWIDMHFKDHKVWCGGVCESCSSNDPYRGLHGNGEHK